MQEIENKKRYIKKICLLGDPAVGKTSLILRFVQHTFSPRYLSTIGAVVYKKQVELEDAVIDLMIWDIAGQETFDAVKLAYFKGADGSFIVCDSSRDTTYEHLEDWINSFSRVQKNSKFVFLANKIDLATDIKAIEEKMKSTAEKHKTQFFFTSAKEGTNVERAFSVLAEKIIKN